MGRDTTTGGHFEEDLSAALTRCGIEFETQVTVGHKPGGGKHRVDHVVMRLNGTKILVSCKTQHVSGTAEEKIPYELIKLSHTLKSDPEQWGTYAVLIINGNGWSGSVKPMLDDDLFKWMPEARNRVHVYYSVEEFIKKEFPGRYTPAVLD